jgi:hypothetical protein
MAKAASNPDKYSVRDMLDPPTDRLNAKVREYVAFAAKTLNLPEPAELPDVIVANKLQEMMVDAGSLDGETFGAYYPGEKPKGDFLLIRDDVAVQIEAENAIAQSVIVHELAHYVAFKAGVDVVKDFGSHQAMVRARHEAEKHAYIVQARWMWNVMRIDPRMFPALTPENLARETGDWEFATLNWLGDGYQSDPEVNWEEYWQGRMMLGDVWSSRPELSIESYKSVVHGGKPPIKFTADGHATQGGKPLFCRLEPLSDLDAILITEGGSANADEYIRAFQHLLDTGLVWQLQGWYGREAKSLIARGDLVEPPL